MTTVAEVSSGRTALLVLLRIAGAGLLGAMAGVHVYLWEQGYKVVPIIGVLFLLNGIGGAVLLIATLATPNRFLGVIAGLGSLFTLGSLGALALSLTVGLFGFQESMVAPLVTTSIIVESAGVVVLAVLSVLGVRAFGLAGNSAR